MTNGINNIHFKKYSSRICNFLNLKLLKAMPFILRNNNKIAAWLIKIWKSIIDLDELVLIYLSVKIILFINHMKNLTHIVSNKLQFMSNRE